MTSRIEYDVFALADIRQDKYKILAEHVEAGLAEFRCARSPHLENFARTQVAKFESHGHSRTYVLITEADGGIDVAGFFTVGMTALNLSKASNSARRKLMGSVSSEHTGAYSIAELARSDDYSSAQLPGSVILDEAKAVIKKARNFVAGRFLVVDARPEVFHHVYEPAGFRKIDVAKPPRDMPDVEFITACALIKDW